MDNLLFIVSLLFATSLAMAGAMTLAWAQFGRERHLRLWASAYSASAIQWLLNGTALALASEWIMYLSGVAMIASIGLTYAGVRTRSEQNRSVSTEFWFCGMFALVCAVLLGILGSSLLVAAIIPAFVGVLMAASSYYVIVTGRTLRAAERAYAATLLLFAAFELALVYVGFQAATSRSAWLDVYRTMLSVGLPMLFVATAIASILMVAGDLAEQLKLQALIDPLTGVYNRRALDELAARSLASARRRNQPLSVVLCDLDGFKLLNDTYGHQAGDSALQQFANALTDELRGDDIVCRIGGDEFLLILLDSNATQTQAALERIKVRISSIVLASVRGTPLRFSFGVAEVQSADLALHHLITQADQALYRAKASAKTMQAL